MHEEIMRQQRGKQHRGKQHHRFRRYGKSGPDLGVHHVFPGVQHAGGGHATLCGLQFLPLGSWHPHSGQQHHQHPALDSGIQLLRPHAAESWLGCRKPKLLMVGAGADMLIYGATMATGGHEIVTCAEKKCCKQQSEQLIAKTSQAVSPLRR